MERSWDLSTISDGKLYSENDLVKVGCQNCKGCSACCQKMGNSIVLDPFDIYQLTMELGQTTEELLSQTLELNVVDGLILPNLKMQKYTDACFFLNSEGRCTIHSVRPGICRIFPLGRLYEGNGFRYFLQVHECKIENRTKVRIKQWIDIPEYKSYAAFIADWHYWLKKYQDQAKQGILRDEKLKQFNLLLLNVFYLTPYKKEIDFYQQYEQRKEWVMASIG